MTPINPAELRWLSMLLTESGARAGMADEVADTTGGVGEAGGGDSTTGAAGGGEAYGSGFAAAGAGV